MSEETKAPRLQEQIKRVEQTLKRLQFIVFVTFLLGGTSAAISNYFYLFHLGLG
jgi:hypothetical protein